MAENNLHPCPFMYRCAHADKSCSEEKSANCEVLTNTTPPPPKKWNPTELVAVTMTQEQWRDISYWIKYCIDWHRCRETWWARCCADKKMGAEIAAQHTASIQAGETMLQIIEEATNEESESQ